MGIRGLRSFMEGSDILKAYCLKNTRIVIDGNNICHQLLNKGDSRQYGGNYIKFKEETKKFFSILLNSNVQPFVVFDGAHDEDDKKLEDIQKECEKRMKECEKEISTSLECFPVFAYEVFTMILKEMKIPHVACDGEADNQIAVLAKQWCCPVISDDSDMYIYNLPGGFIHYKDLHLAIDNATADGIPTKLYLTKGLEEKLGFAANILPLAATTLGNVYGELDYNVANLFYQRLGANASFSSISRDLRYAFEVLRNVKTLDNGLRLLMQCTDEILPTDKAIEMKRKIQTSIRVYTENNFIFFDIAQYFEGKQTTKPHKYLPEFVMKSIRSCALSGLPIDVSIGRVILKPTLEKLDQPPVQNVCLPLRRIIYGMVISCCENVQRDEITEILRCKKAMTRILVKPVTSINGYGPVPSLQTIEGQDDKEKIELIAAIFQLQCDLSGIPEQSIVFLLALNFFRRNGFCRITTAHLKAYVFCHVLLLMRENDPSIQSLYKSLSHKENEHDPDLMFFHNYLQSFQQCLNMAYTFNTLLRTPFPQPDPSTVYDGPLMYHFIKQISTDDNVDKLVQKCLPENYRLLSRALLCKIGIS